MGLYNDGSGREPAVRTLFVRGVATLGGLAMVVSLLLMQSRGTFTDAVTFHAELDTLGDGLRQGADVKSRGVLIGTVGSLRTEGTRNAYRQTVELRVKPEYAGAIPESARARVVPSNLFGSPSIQLLATPGDTRLLEQGAAIPADRSRKGLMMQTTFSRLTEVLIAVQPAKLSGALTNIARAMSGRGEQIGKTLEGFDRYFSEINRHRPEVTRSLNALADSLEALDKNARPLLDTVDSYVTTSHTLATRREEFAATLTGVASTSNSTNALLAQNREQLITVMQHGAKVTETVAASGEYIAPSFLAIGKAASSLISATSGDKPTANLDIILSLSPFDPYTAADCPRYGKLEGPNCGDTIPNQPPNPPPPSPPDEPLPHPGLLPLPPVLQAPLENLLPGLLGGLRLSGQAESVSPSGLSDPVGDTSEAEALNTLLAGTGLEENSAVTLLLAPILRGTSVVRM